MFTVAESVMCQLCLDFLRHLLSPGCVLRQRIGMLYHLLSSAENPFVSIVLWWFSTVVTPHVVFRLICNLSVADCLVPLTPFNDPLVFPIKLFVLWLCWTLWCGCDFAFDPLTLIKISGMMNAVKASSEIHFYCSSPISFVYTTICFDKFCLELYYSLIIIRAHCSF